MINTKNMKLLVDVLGVELNSIKKTTNITYSCDLVDDDGVERSYIIFDLINIQSKIDFGSVIEIIEESDIQTKPIFIFKSWYTEREIFRKEYMARSSKEKNDLVKLFNKCLILYSESNNRISIEVDDCINFLEYKEGNSTKTDGKATQNIEGKIFNITFNELLNIYNVKGKGLFDENIRFGIASNGSGSAISTNNKLKNIFENYLKLSILNIIGDTIEDDFLYDKLNQIMQVSNFSDEEKVKYNPNNFWFSHNGITMYSYGMVEFTASKITVNPRKVSVINGAQTLTKFFEAYDEIQYVVVDGLYSIIKKYITEIIKKSVDYANDDSENKDLIIEWKIDNFIVDISELFDINHSLREAKTNLDFEGVETKPYIDFEIDKLNDQKLIKSVKNVIDVLINRDVLKSFYIKTIIIQGEKNRAKEIAIGLNTQTPISAEDILSNSDDVQKINKLFGEKVKILKPGESHHNEYGYSVIEFVKNYLTISGQPGKSKNLAKRDIPAEIINIKKEFSNNSNINKFVNNNALLEEIYKWWRRTVKDRRNENEASKSQSDLIIQSYSKNYFASYIINHHNIDAGEVSDELFVQLYIEFSSLLKSMKGELEIQDFKNDKIYNDIKSEKNKSENNPAGESINSKFEISIEQKKELIKLLNQEHINQYSIARTISNFLKIQNNMIFHFRVISIVNDKIKEDFPFPSSTFNELLENPGLDYKDSLFFKNIEKKFPVFILYRDQDNTKAVKELEFIDEFSFSDYTEEAEVVFNLVKKCLVEGDIYQLPKISDELYFHIRTKAMTASDTIEFTNGELITKRTFWGNKSTLKLIIDKSIEKNMALV